MPERDLRKEFEYIKSLEGSLVKFQNENWVVWKVSLDTATIELHKGEEVKHISLPVFMEAMDGNK